jgi:hypothetical protein
MKPLNTLYVQAISPKRGGQWRRKHPEAMMYKTF